MRVPTGARTGNLQVITEGGSDAYRLTVTSPWVRSVSPRTGRSNTLVTVTGSNFGASRGSSSVRIGTQVISSYYSWSSSIVRFRIPVNTRPGELRVRTSEGTSNSIRLEVTSPYLTWDIPVPCGHRGSSHPDWRQLRQHARHRLRRCSRVTLGRHPRTTRAGVTPGSVNVPDRAESGDVKVVTALGSSGTRRIDVEGEDLESLPSTGIFGYDPPTVTGHPKSVSSASRESE